MKKRVLSIILAALVIVGALPCAAAGADGKNADLVVETMSGTYYFNVGDTFSYSFWLRVSADFINYSADEIAAAAAGSDLSGIIGRLLGNKDILADSKMKSVYGAVYFDPDYLELQDSFMPNLRNGICASTGNKIVKTALELVGGDTTRTGLGFYCSVFSDAEKTQFNNEELVLVQCFLKVKRPCDEPVKIRTRLAKLTVSADINGTRRDLDLVKKSKAYFTYESYDTINDEKPTVMLKSLVADCAFDVRCIMSADAVDTYIRPDRGVTVNMMGFTFDGRYIKLTGQTPASGEVWFYDVPYGEYYVECGWKNASGQGFATKNWDTAEHVNIPATGSVQALWLFYEDPLESKDIDVYIKWEGDDGYIPARPEALMAYLYEGTNSYAAVDKLLIDPTDEMISFYSVDAYEDGEPLYYLVRVEPALGEWDYKCTYEHLIPGEDEGVTNETFCVTCTYTGPQSALNVIERDEYGHYWELVTGMTGSATCTEPGTAYYMCLACHQFKHVEVESLGHVWGSWSYDNNATCYADGTKTHKCLRCGEAETVTDEGSRNDAHVWGSWTSNKDSTCTEDGTRTRTCTLCKASETSADAGSALGHCWGALVSNNDETCTQDGTATAACTRTGCTATKTVTDIGSAKHLWGEWTSDNNATCTKDGTKTHKCLRCGEAETVTDTGSKNDAHVWGAWVSNNDATCTNDGTKTRTCTADGCIAHETAADVGSALGHRWGAWETVSEAGTPSTALKRHCIRSGCRAEEKIPVDGIMLSMDDNVVYSGRQIRVPVNITGNTGIAVMNFKIEYDHSVLKLVDYEDGLMTGWMIGIGEGEKAIWVDNSDFRENGTVLTLIFEAAENVTFGDTFVRLTGISASDYSEHRLDLSSLPAFVQLLERLPGDVNGDGTVNIFDLLRLKKHLANLPVEIVEANSNVTGGERIGAADLLRLKKYLAGYSVTLE